MLDSSANKPRLGSLLLEAQNAWRLALHEALLARGAPILGAGGDLLALIGPDGIPQSLLVERAGLSKQAVQQSLDLLEKQGFVQREADPSDRRAKRVRITAAGAEALAARRQAERLVEQQWRAALGRKAWGRLRKGLRKLGGFRESTPG